MYNSIPEINSGLIEIVNVQRIPGERTKAVFRATPGNEHLDVYGAIIGHDSSRINLIISEPKFWCKSGWYGKIRRYCLH